MRRAVALPVLCGLLFSVACAATRAGGELSKATHLAVREPEFFDAEVVLEKTMPPRFLVVLRREMPTPGWRFEIDAVEADTDSRRIVARISEIGPSGITSQVITKTDCRIPLGTLEPGTWLLEIRLRRGGSGEHRPAQALVLDAR